MIGILAFIAPRALACAAFIILPALPYLGHRLLCRQCGRPQEPTDRHAAGPLSFDGIPKDDEIGFRAALLGLSGDLDQAATRHNRKHLGERS